MDFSQVLMNHEVTSSRPGDSHPPELIAVTSHALWASHEEVLIATTHCLLSTRYTRCVGLLVAANHPVSRYCTALDPLIRRSAGRQALACFDLADEVAQSDVSQTKSRLEELIGAVVEEAGEEKQYLVVIDDLGALQDLGIPTARLLANLLQRKSSHMPSCLVIGYHGNCDAAAASAAGPDDYLLEMVRRRADWLVEVAPLETGYAKSLDGKLTVSRRGDARRKQSRYHFFAKGQSIICHPPGASNLVT